MSVVLSEHLPLLASAPDGIQKLRGLILELAVRGKLVSQDPGDEPASELLKRIAKERAQLEEEGVCKRSKPLSPVGDDEQPFALPRNWAWVRLPEVYFSISPSGNKLLSSAIQETGAVPVVDQGKRYIAGYTDQVSMLINIPGPVVIFGDHTTERKYVDFDFVAGADGVKILRPILQYEKFFFRQLQGFKLEERGYARHFKVLNDQLYALPPLAEQHRIVAKVDELMALCDRLEAEQTDAASAHARLVETLLGTLTQSTDAADLAANWQRLAEHFDNLFTTEASIDALKQTVLQLAVMGKLVPQDAHDEPASALLQKLPRPKKVLAPIDDGELLFEIPINWQWARLGEVFVGGSGTTPARTRHEYFEAGTEYWVKTTDLNNAVVTTCEELITPQAVTDCNLTYFPAGTVCIAMYGGAGTIGKTGVLGINSTINQSVFALPPVKDISPAFTHYYLKSIRGVWMRFAAGLRVAANINGQIIKNMVFPVPPVNEQIRIVAKVDELMAICDNLKDDLATASKRQATLADTLIETALEAA